MQLILDEEAIGINSKMSGIDEEIIDGNRPKNLIENFSNNLPNNGSGVLENISLICDAKEKGLLENHTGSDESTNENLSKTDDTLNLDSNSSNKDESEKSFEVFDNNFIENQNSPTTDKSEKEDVFDDDIKSDHGKVMPCLDLPIVNNDDMNEETAMESNEQCSAENNIEKLDSSFDKNFGFIEDETKRDITNTSEFENILSEDITESNKICNLDNEVENKIDEDAILGEISNHGNSSNSENELENKLDEDALLEDVPENDNISNLENKLESKMDVDAILEEVVENDNTSNLDKEVENKLVEDAGLVRAAENDNITNLENDVENKLDRDETGRKNEEEIIEHRDIENETQNDDTSNCPIDNNLDSNVDHEKFVPNNEKSLTKDGGNIVSMHSLTDKNKQSEIESYDTEICEKGQSTENIQRNSQSIDIKTASTDDQISGKQEESEKESIKDEKQSKGNRQSLFSKLSNTLDILSDDEDELPDIDKNVANATNYNQSISLIDDDVMLIEEDAGEKKENNSQINEILSEVSVKTTLEKQCPASVDINEKEIIHETVPLEISAKNELDCMQNNTEGDMDEKPLLPLNVLKNYKKNLADMTRDELEEFCISKIVESVVNRSNLGDIKAQLKITARTVEEYKKKLMMISKQTRDLQVILKSVQEEQKKPSAYPVTPLKLTRSVGMQVFMTDKPIPKKRQQSLTPVNNLPLDKSNRNNANIKTPKNNQQIPVPRLVPATPATPTPKASSTTQAIVNNAVVVKSSQVNNALVNGLRNSPPAQKPEKRTRVQTFNTVDLTDDEPPSKIVPKSSPTPPVRLIPPQNLLAPQRQPFAPNINSPRKVYIPISSPHNQNIRPGQTYLLKSVPPNPGPRPRGPTPNNLPKVQPNSIRMNRPQHFRHPAPLPDAMKQYQPPNWKALPPAPDLKLSKVDNGIVISWKIDGYQDDSYEEITSYQLFAYQETATPPSTALWKKIGDVKALPLPMACTLTQFMAGYKYYFAVRAVDVKSRLGPFSLPGSILLLNKM